MAMGFAPIVTLNRLAIPQAVGKRLTARWPNEKTVGGFPKFSLAVFSSLIGFHWKARQVLADRRRGWMAAEKSGASVSSEASNSMEINAPANNPRALHPLVALPRQKGGYWF